MGALLRKCRGRARSDRHQGLLLAGGGLQNNIGHHGYAYFLALSWWYDMLHFFGLVPVATLSKLMSLPDRVSTFAQMIVAGRIFSMLMGAVLSAGVVLAVYALTRYAAVALIVSAMFALGVGLGFQTIALRSEMPAVLFAFLAFLALIQARKASTFYVWLAVAGLCRKLTLLPLRTNL